MLFLKSKNPWSVVPQGFQWLRRRDSNHATFGLWARQATNCSTPRYDCRTWCFRQICYTVLLVLVAGLEPARRISPTDFKSGASANSATRANKLCWVIVSFEIWFVKPFLLWNSTKISTFCKNYTWYFLNKNFL